MVGSRKDDVLIVDFIEIEEFTWVLTAVVGALIVAFYHFSIDMSVGPVEIGGGDGVHVFTCIGYLGLLYTIALLMMAQSTMTRFLKLAGLEGSGHHLWSRRDDAVWKIAARRLPTGKDMINS